MQFGYNPGKAAKLAINMIVQYYTDFSGAVVVVDHYGHYGAACHGFDQFPYSIANSQYDSVSVLNITCTKS